MPVHQVIGRQTSILTVDPSVAYELVPAPLGHGPGESGYTHTYTHTQSRLLFNSMNQIRNLHI